MSYTLNAPDGSFRAIKALIAAEYNGVSVNVVSDSDVKTLSPSGKGPVLQTPSGSVIFGSNAIARLIAKIRRDTGLAGSTLDEEATIDSWVDFSANELELPASVWTYPVLGYMPFNAAA